MVNVIGLYKFVNKIDEFNSDILNKNMIFSAFNEMEMFIFNEPESIQSYKKKGFKVRRLNDNGMSYEANNTGSFMMGSKQIPIYELLYRYIITRKIYFLK